MHNSLKEWFKTTLEKTDPCELNFLMTTGQEIAPLPSTTRHHLLWFAANENQLEALQLVLSSTKDINTPIFGFGETALHAASRKGHVAIMTALMEAGANLEVKNVEGKTALHLAAQSQKIEAVKTLIAKGALVNVLDRQLRIPLHDTNNDTIAMFLVLKGANIAAQDMYGNTTLHFAAAYNLPELTKLLLAQNQPITTNVSNETPLHLAAGHHPSLTLPLLIDKCAIETKTRQGLTAVQYAAATGSLSSIYALCAKGATVEMLDPQQQTLPHLLALAPKLKGELAPLHPLLLRCAVNARDKQGWTALHLAARLNRPAMISALLAAGAQSTLVCHNKTALDLAFEPETRDLLTQNAHKVSRAAAQISFSQTEPPKIPAALPATTSNRVAVAHS